MVFLQALLTWLTRSLGKFFQAAFGWAVVALFGPRPKREQAILSAAVGAAAAWPLLVLGIVFPRIASFVLAFVPLSRSIPTGALRVAWAAAALAVPAGLGLLLARESAPAPSRAWWRRVAEGFPATLGVACALLFIAIAVPVRKVVAMARRRVSVHVPVVVGLAAYGELADLIGSVLRGVAPETSRARAPLAEEAPVRLLRWIGGPLFRRQLPARLVSFRGAGLTTLISPNGLSIEGPEFVVTRVRGLLAEALTFSLALQTLDPEAQNLERRLKDLVDGGRARAGAPVRPKRAADPFEGLKEQLLAADVPWDDWQVLYREMLQIARARELKAPLSKSVLGSGRGEARARA